MDEPTQIGKLPRWQDNGKTEAQSAPSRSGWQAPASAEE